MLSVNLRFFSSVKIKSCTLTQENGIPIQMKKPITNKNSSIQSDFGKVYGKGSQKVRSYAIDLGLAVLRERVKRRTPIPASLIAAYCGCSTAYINEVLSNALKKIRRHPTLGSFRIR